MPNISVLILTKNEQQDLPACLESVSWADDIHVYDSMSTDQTVAIAKKFGAQVTQRGYPETTLAFGGDEAAHRNWGLTHISFKHPWILQLDADERVNNVLVVEIKNILTTSTHSAYRIRRRDFFMSKWLRHVQASPFYLRLFRVDKLHYERLINPISIVDGSIGELHGFFEHFPFSKGISHWIDKHNHYSTLEARQIIRNNQDKVKGSVKKAFFASDFHERRSHQKALFYRFPARPMIKFFILYLAKLGFLDGRAGLSYALLQSIYEYMIVLKVRELALQAQDTVEE